MSLFGVLMGKAVLITGLSEQTGGSIKVYVGPRYRHNYVVVSDPAEQDKVRRAWGNGRGGGHLFAELAPDAAIFTDPPEGSDAHSEDES